MAVSTVVLAYIIVMAFASAASASQNRRHRLQSSPGILLRDLLDNGVNTGSDQDYSSSHVGVLSSQYTGNNLEATPEDAAQELLASLSEYDIDAERPSAHFLLELFERLQSGQELTQASGHGRGSVANADTIRTYTPTVGNRANLNSRSELRMSFQLSGMTSREKTHLAELRIRPVNQDTHRNNRHQSNKLQRIRVIVFQNGERVKQENFRVRVQQGTTDGFDVMEITTIIQAITADLDHANDTRVEIRIRQKDRQRDREVRDGSSTRRREIRSVRSRRMKSQEALLVVYSQDQEFFSQFRMPLPEHISTDESGSSLSAVKKREDISRQTPSRFRRGANKDRGSRDPCGKKDMVVDFDEIGWGKWIVYPKQFNAFQCSGRCPTPVDQYFEPTNHAILQSMMRLHYKDTVGRPCCAPTRLAPLSMLYYEYGEIVVRHHQDMVIAKCGCR